METAPLDKPRIYGGRYLGVKGVYRFPTELVFQVFGYGLLQQSAFGISGGVMGFLLIFL